MARFSAVVILAAIRASSFGSVQIAPASDPQAIAYAAQSVTAMRGTMMVSDVTLTGVVNTWMSGSVADSGTVTLKLKGFGESRIDMQLVGNGTLSEIRDVSTGFPQGEWITPLGSNVYPQQACVADPAWFYALNSAMAAAPNNGAVLLYLGAETLNGSSVQHLQSYSFQSGLDPTSQAQLQAASTIDYYLDSTTFLPLAESFNLFSNDHTAIPVQILFLNYSTAAGLTVPHHIQKYINGTLIFDASITSVFVNTGIPLSTFVIPQ